MQPHFLENSLQSKHGDYPQFKGFDRNDLIASFAANPLQRPSLRFHYSALETIKGMTEYRKKLIEVALPLEAINEASAREKVDQARASLDTASVVGAAAAGGVPGGAVCAACGRPVVGAGGVSG